VVQPFDYGRLQGFECSGVNHRETGRVFVTNTIALYLGVFLVLVLGADLLANDGAAVMFVMHKFLDLVEWVAFWR
jgi:hypothetical protein